MTLASILVVDPDAVARAQMAAELRGLGHDVAESESAGAALAAIKAAQPDLLICDRALPDLDGVELLSDVRRSEDLKSLRVLMTSGGADSSDIVMALERGADDYVGKPLDMVEFLARVGACLRRPANPHTSSLIVADGITIDNVSHRVAVDDTYVGLAPREYRLLLFLLTNQDRVFSREQLLVRVWDRDGHPSDGSAPATWHTYPCRAALLPSKSRGAWR